MTVQIWITSRLAFLHVFIGSIFSQIGTTIHDKILAVATWLYNKWEEIKNGVVQKVQNLVSGVVGFFKQLPGKVAEWIINMKNTMMDKLGQLAHDALDAGANIVKNIASGILGAIGNFIGGAQRQRCSFLHPYLPPGPTQTGTRR